MSGPPSATPTAASALALALAGAVAVADGARRASGDCWDPGYPAQWVLIALFAGSCVASVLAVSLGVSVRTRSGPHAPSAQRLSCTPADRVMATAAAGVGALALVSSGLFLAWTFLVWPPCVD